jgi:hypothetical protein
MRKKMKCETCHGKNDEKNEFGNPRSESLGFKSGTPIILGPKFLGQPNYLAKLQMGVDGCLFLVKCKVCSEVEHKNKLLAPNWDSL